MFAWFIIRISFQKTNSSRWKERIAIDTSISIFEVIIKKNERIGFSYAKTNK